MQSPTNNSASPANTTTGKLSANGDAANVVAPVTLLPPMILALRNLFAILTNDQFTSECEIEKRRRAALLQKKKKKPPPRPPAAASKAPNNNNKKRVADSVGDDDNSSKKQKPLSPAEEEEEYSRLTSDTTAIKKPSSVGVTLPSGKLLCLPRKNHRKQPTTHQDRWLQRKVNQSFDAGERRLAFEACSRLGNGACKKRKRSSHH